MIHIRPAKANDFKQIWVFFKDIIADAETYAFSPDLTEDDAFQLWMETPLQTFVAEENGCILGTYYIKENQSGPGGHVANCGYMVSPMSRGKGIATQMCVHSQEFAVNAGFYAMQFNSVVSTNVGAVRLWQSLGFSIVGTLPKAYHHKTDGFVDSYVMYKWLIN